MSLAASLPDAALPPFFRLLSFEALSSTNDEAKRLAQDGAAEGTLVVAERQLAGRGRRGRAWVSPAGNLYSSFIFRPDRPASEAAQLSFVAALAVAEALTALAPGAEVRLKWPNDVLLGGGKVAGILLESAAGAAYRLDWLVIGIGVNLLTHPPDAATGATSLAGACGTTVGAPQALRVLAERLLSWYRVWQSDGFGPVRAAWMARAQGVGAPITVRLADQVLEGRFADLDMNGALLLRTADAGIRPVNAGEVYFPTGQGG